MTDRFSHERMHGEPARTPAEGRLEPLGRRSCAKLVRTGTLVSNYRTNLTGILIQGGALLRGAAHPAPSGSLGGTRGAGRLR